MPNKIDERRKVRIVDSKFQKKLISRFCFLVIAGSIITTALVYLLAWSSMTTVFDYSRMAMKTTADFILPFLLISGALVTAGVVATVVTVTFFISHRIAGPVYRLGKDIAGFARGNLGQGFHVRHKDELQNLAASLNEMAKQLRADFGRIKELAGKIEAVQDSRENLAELKKLLDKYQA